MYDIERWFHELCKEAKIPLWKYPEGDTSWDRLLIRVQAGEFGKSVGDIAQLFLTQGPSVLIGVAKSTSRKSNAESSIPLLDSGTSSKNSDEGWTFTASWPANFTDSQSINPCPLSEELANSWNLAADTARVIRQSSGLPEQAHTVRLYVSRRNREYRRVISIETRTRESPSSGDTGSSDSST
jgi:hypothetical protein